MDLPKRVTVCEVAPRDGLQSEKPVSTETKIKFVDLLTAAGLKVVELTSFVHPKLVPQMADAEEVISGVQAPPGVLYRGLALNPKGVERAVKSGVAQVKVGVSATDAHSQENAHCTTRQAVESIGVMAEMAARANLPIAGGIAVAFWCPYEGAVPIERLEEICAEYQRMHMIEINLSDTAGMTNPKHVYETVVHLRSRFPDLKFGLHVHDTYGTGLANVLAALEAGIERFDASAGGLGGCPFIPHASGNIATEDLVYMLDGMGIETGVDLDKLLQAAEYIEGALGHTLYSHTYQARKSSCSLSSG